VLPSPGPFLLAKARVLVTGASGMLASDLIPALAGAGGQVFSRSKAELDIARAEDVAAAFREVRPDVVVNCAAFTKVDAAETDPRAFEVNAHGVELLASECLARPARLVHISTDFVFDGGKRSPYVEEDATAPLSGYGRSKLAGEDAALRVPSALVVRASWLFGLMGWNFVEAILKQIDEGKRTLTVVEDQRGRPTATTDLAAAVVALLEAGALGTYHFANVGEVTWFDFARAILELGRRSEVEVVPIRSEALARPAARPAYSVLDTSKFERATGRTIRHFREPLAQYLAARAVPPA
jgi:dTDP-4-dehydrorhamnose reductase